MKLIITTLLLLSSFAFALDKNSDPKLESLYVRQTNQCHYAGFDFQVISAGLTKKSDSEEDGFGTATLWVKIGDQNPILAVRDKNLEDGSFTVRRIGNFNSSICYGVAALDLSKTAVALTFIQDARPGGENLGAIFMDVKTGKILKTINSLGTVDEESYGLDTLMDEARAKTWGIASPSPSFWFSIRESRSEATSGETTIHGQKFSFVDKDLGIVKRVSLENDVIHVETDDKATISHSAWNIYFKPEELEKAAGWNPSKKEFSYNTIWVASQGPNDGPIGRCVQFAHKSEDLKNDQWRCRK